jgi:NADPH2:quinone reductase
VPGIEAVGVVARCPGGEFPADREVAAMMGGTGRVSGGGYAEYTCVPASQVIAFRSELERATLGAVPEMRQTSYGSLTIGLDAHAGQSILIRGGTSSVGMTTAVLARQRGMTVLATTRNPAKRAALTGIGADHVLIDDGHIARQVHAVLGHGADTALELVGTPTLPDTLRATRVHGVVCFTGMLSSQWTVRDFYPIEYIPRGVRLTSYGADLLRRRRPRPAPARAASLPRCRRVRRRHHPDRPRLPPRRDRRGPHRHGGRHRGREAGRHYMTAARSVTRTSAHAMRRQP